MRYWGVVALFVAFVAGCAAPPASEEAAALEPSSVACPQVEGVELPPECIPYDPDAYINSNLAYKDRMEVTEKAFAGFEAKREQVESAIAGLQESENVTIDSVKDVLESAGFGPQGGDPVKTWENLDGVNFTAGGPTSGCVEGTVSIEAFEMTLKGYINDGGCVPAVGH